MHLQEQEMQLTQWLEERKGIFEKQMDTLYKDIEKDMQNYKYFTYLQSIFQNPHIKPQADDIYHLLTPLSEDPKLLYKPLFEKIKTLNIHQDITNKVQAGLDKLKQTNI